MDGRFGTGFFPAYELDRRSARQRTAQRGHSRARGRVDSRLRLARPDRAVLYLDLPAWLSAEKDVRAPRAVCHQGDAAFSRPLMNSGRLMNAADQSRLIDAGRVIAAR